MIRKAEVQQAERDLFQAIVTMVQTKTQFGLRRIGGHQEHIEEAAEALSTAESEVLIKAVNWQLLAEEYDAQISFRFAGRRRRVVG